MDDLNLISGKGVKISLSSSVCEEFKPGLHGYLITPFDPTYNEVRIIGNGMHVLKTRFDSTLRQFSRCGSFVGAT